MYWRPGCPRCEAELQSLERRKERAVAPPLLRQVRPKLFGQFHRPWRIRRSQLLQSYLLQPVIQGNDSVEIRTPVSAYIVNPTSLGLEPR